MVRTASTMLPLGTASPEFALPDTTGKTVSLADFRDAPALLVMFICNHCPYVKHVADGLAKLVKEYQARGVAAVGINVNDIAVFLRTRRPKWPRKPSRGATPSLIFMMKRRRCQGVSRGLHAGFLRLRP